MLSYVRLREQKIVNDLGYMTNFVAMIVDSKTFKIYFSGTNEPMALKIDMWHWVLDYCQDYSKSDLTLTSAYGKVKYGKTLWFYGKF